MKRKKSDVIVYLVIAAVFCLQLTYTAVRTDKVSQVEAAEISTKQIENTEEEAGEDATVEDLPMVDISGQVARMAEAAQETEAVPETASAEAAAASETTPEAAAAETDANSENVVQYAANIDVAALEAKAAEAATAEASQAAKMTAAQLRAEQAAEAAAEEQTGGELSVVNAERALNVRQAPGEDQELVARLYRGAGVKIQQVEGEWSKVLSGEVSGWVLSSYLVSGQEAEALVAEMNPQVAKVVTGELCVRSGPDEEAQILTVVEADMYFPVLEIQGSWVKIQVTSNVEGFVHADYVSVSQGLMVGTTLTQETALQEDISSREEARQAAAEEAAARKAAEESRKSSSSSSSSSSGSSGSGSSSSGSSSSSSDSGSSSHSGWRSLGTFRITAYCACSRCNGGSSGLTASGTVPEVGYTIAVDPSVISMGSEVQIEGQSGTFCALDTGVSGNSIDLFMSSHSEALAWGVRYREVWVQE